MATSALSRLLVEIFRERDFLLDALSRDASNPPRTRRDQRRQDWQSGKIQGWEPPGRTARLLARFEPSSGLSRVTLLHRDVIAEARADETASVLLPIAQSAVDEHNKLLAAVREADDKGDGGLDGDTLARHGTAVSALIPYVSKPVAATSTSSAISGKKPETPSASASKLEAFRGGQLIFFSDRVELCGAVICSGPRSQTRRRILDLLRTRQSDGSFLAYSGKRLASLLEPKGTAGTVAGAIRDLRDHIAAALRKANLEYGREDVILSGGPGYRFADCLTVQVEGEGSRRENQGRDVSDDDPDVPNDPDPDDPNDSEEEIEAKSRRDWIIEELSKGRRLRAPDIKKELKCSLKTAKRDLKSLKGTGRIEFVGSPSTGHYRLVRTKPR